VEGGADKGPDGHRRDTLPIVRALRARGWDAEVLFYTDAARAALTAHAAASADAFLFRVNPGAYPALPGGYSEAAFLQMGRDLHALGCHALQHPDVMLSYGAKDSLVKLRSTATGLPDTEVYYDAGSFLRGFPQTLAKVRAAAGRAGGRGLPPRPTSRAQSGSVRQTKPARFDSPPSPHPPSPPPKKTTTPARPPTSLTAC
jgi:hypothetical protein